MNVSNGALAVEERGKFVDPLTIASQSRDDTHITVIPGLTRNPGGYGSNVDLDSGSEAGVTDKKTGRSDR